MSRKPRIHLAGGMYHVMLRGNGGQAIFFSERDRQVIYIFCNSSATFVKILGVRVWLKI